MRNDHLHIIKYLISKGADLGAETIDGYSVLTLAMQILPPGAETIKYLESIDAPDGNEDDDKEEGEEGGEKKGEKEGEKKEGEGGIEGGKEGGKEEK